MVLHHHSLAQKRLLYLHVMYMALRRSYRYVYIHLMQPEDIDLMTSGLISLYGILLKVGRKILHLSMITCGLSCLTIAILDVRKHIAV